MFDNVLSITLYQVYDECPILMVSDAYETKQRLLLAEVPGSTWQWPRYF
jgi:hypothetical protein